MSAVNGWISRTRPFGLSWLSRALGEESDWSKSTLAQCQKTSTDGHFDLISEPAHPAPTLRLGSVIFARDATPRVVEMRPATVHPYQSSRASHGHNAPVDGREGRCG